MSRLVGGSAVVTGGGSGIGRAIAIAMAEQATSIGVVDLLAEGGNGTVAAVRERGSEAIFAQADVSRWEEVDRAFGLIVDSLGPLGIVVNAAGILDGYASADAVELAVWERVIDTNLTGTFLCCKRALAELLPNGRGRIINIASTAGLVGAGGGAAYVASKHGIVGLTRQLAVEYAERGVTVNAICPGPITTELRAHSAQILGPDAPPMDRGIGVDESALRATVPLARRGTVDEIAAAACFLASEAAAYITGHTLVVDGGWTAR